LNPRTGASSDNPTIIELWRVITTGIAKNRSKRKQERLGRGVAKLPEDGGGEERSSEKESARSLAARVYGGDRRREAREVGFLKFWSRSVVSCPVAHPPHDGPQAMQVNS
jgi:hypothetical protein